MVFLLEVARLPSRAEGNMDRPVPVFAWRRLEYRYHKPWFGLACGSCQAGCFGICKKGTCRWWGPQILLVEDGSLTKQLRMTTQLNRKSPMDELVNLLWH